MRLPQSTVRRLSVALSLTGGLLLSACGGGGAGGDGASAERPATLAAAPEPSIQSLLSLDALAVATLQTATHAEPVSAEPPNAQQVSVPEVEALAVVKGSGSADAITTTGATFYVDSRLGNDSYSGIAPVPGVAGVGPWRTLAKLTQTGFSPGDTIRLACGSVWNETLRLNSSGTAGSPITVAAASSNCATPPTIDGSVAIPAANWVRHSGSIFRTALSKSTQNDNLVVNGDFALANGGWTVWSPKNDAVKQQVAACDKRACMNVTTVADTSLLSSNTFAVQASVTYTTQFALKAPIGTRVRVFVRRAAAPYDAVGYAQAVSGNGAWQTFSTSFVASSGLANARLDFEIPAPGVTVQIAAAAVVAPSSAVTPTVLVPLQLTATNGLLSPAHHPNRGYNAAQPSTVYLRSASDSDRVTVNGQTVSTYLTTGADLTLPAGATIPNGTTVRIRTNSWTISESKTTGFSNSRIALATPTAYPISAGWGYFLLGQLWMLDSPGEWFYDSAIQTLYAWMPDGAAPSEPVSATYQPAGIDATGRQYTVFDGLSIRNVGVGVNMRYSTGVVVRNARIEDTASFGVDAGGGVSNVVDQCAISRTGGDAITGVDYGVPTTIDMQVTNNRIDQSGVRVSGNTVLSLPVSSGAAIRAGYHASVVGNTVSDTGWLGIWMLGQSTVRDNYVQGACTVLDDCGGIYTNGKNNGSFIANNIVERSRGTIDGKPAAQAFTQAQGIYLDFLTSNVTVEGNTVMFNDYGIQIHDAANNILQGNKLYGNRLAQLWLQEQTTKTRASGDIYGNTIKANQFVPTTAGALGFKQSSEISSTFLFGTFDYNRYFDRIYDNIGRESAPTMTPTDYTISTWKAAVSAAGVPRGQDANGHAASQQLFATYLISGSNIVPNGNLATDVKGWVPWNQTAPFGSLVRQPCATGFCAMYTAGASDGILSSPNFSMRQGQWYRLSVDVMTAAEGQTVSIIVRRGGGGANGYEGLGGYQAVTAGTTWKRFTFTFSASKTLNANDPLTGDLGARVDFQQIKPGQRVTVSNLELVPIITGETLTQVAILVNTSATPLSMACPTATSSPAACAIFARLSDDTAITWPYLLAARSSEVIYTRDGRLADADGDGIADSQDTCPVTLPGTAVGADGCSFAQRH